MEQEDWTPVLDAQRRSDDRMVIDALVAALEKMIAWANGAPGGYPGTEAAAALAIARRA